MGRLIARSIRVGGFSGIFIFLQAALSPAGAANMSSLLYATAPSGFTYGSTTMVPATSETRRSVHALGHAVPGPPMASATRSDQPGLIPSMFTAPRIWSRETIDINQDGQIDRILLRFTVPIDDQASQTTFDVGESTGESFFTDTGGDALAFVLFTPDATPDTDRTPTHQVVTNTSLSDPFGNNVPEDPSPVGTEDRAPPILLSQTAIDDDSNGFLDRVVYQFSEPLLAGEEDVSDWVVIDADGVTDLLAVVDDLDVSISGDTVTISVSNDRGSVGNPETQYASDGQDGALQDPSGNLVPLGFLSASTVLDLTLSPGGPITTGYEIFTSGEDQLHARVVDGTANGNPGSADTVVVQLAASNSVANDAEVLTLLETGVNTGVFQNSTGVPFLVAPTLPGNLQLETTHGGTVTATYLANQRIATITVGSLALSSIEFTDESGTPQSEYAIGAEELFVTLVDQDQNRDGTLLDTVSVSIRNLVTGDFVSVILTEVGSSTGTFRNLTGVTTELGTAVTDAVLQVANGSTIEASYQDSFDAGDTGSASAQVSVATIEFVDNLGFSVAGYVRTQDLIYIKVRDIFENTNPGTLQTLVATVFDDTSGDTENLTLLEDDPNSGVFVSTVGLGTLFAFPLPPTGDNGILETRTNTFLFPSQTLRARYVSPTFPTVQVEDTAALTLADLNDSDDDGISDSAETSFGLNPFDPNDAALDADGDGWSNLEEYQLGTDPINSSDRVPVANAGAAFSVHPGEIEIDGSTSTDPQGEPLTYSWQQVNAGQSGHGPAVAIADANQVVTYFIGLGGTGQSLYEFDLIVSNSRVSSLPDRLVVTVSNIDPSADAGFSQSVAVGSTITAQGLDSSDANSEALTFAWSSAGNVNFSGGSQSSGAASVAALAPGAHELDLITTDPSGRTGTSSTYLVAHSATNHVPVGRIATPVPAFTGQPLLLDGSTSRDADWNDTLTYSWIVSRFPVGAGIVSPSPVISQSPTTLVVPTLRGSYEVTLIVIDVAGNRSIPVKMPFTVEDPGNPATTDGLPSAVAGPDQIVEVLDTVTLDGSASADPEGATLAYQWSQIAGVSAKIEGADGAQASWTPIFPGIYRFQLVVSDAAGASAPDEIVVIVNNPTVSVGGPVQHVPVAWTGPDQFLALQQTPLSVTLDGSASLDDDGDTLSFFWTQDSGPGVPLTNFKTSSPTFNPIVVGDYEFSLRVFDGKNFSLPSRTTVEVQPGIGATPVAVAGVDQSLEFNGTPVQVQLNGQQSLDPGGRSLVFRWIQTAGTPVTLSPSFLDPAPSFAASVPGTYGFQLTVRNSAGVASSPSSVSITLTSGQGEEPVIRFKDGNGEMAQEVPTGQIVILDVTESFAPQGGTLTYRWEKVSGPGEVVFSNPRAARTTVTLLLSGQYVFRVTVTDDRGFSAQGLASITAQALAPPDSGDSDETTVTAESLARGGGGGGVGCSAHTSTPSEPVSLLWLALLWFWFILKRWRPRGPSDRNVKVFVQREISI